MKPNARGSKGVFCADLASAAIFWGGSTSSTKKWLCKRDAPSFARQASRLSPFRTARIPWATERVEQPSLFHWAKSWLRQPSWHSHRRDPHFPLCGRQNNIHPLSTGSACLPQGVPVSKKSWLRVPLTLSEAPSAAPHSSTRGYLTGGDLPRCYRLTDQALPHCGDVWTKAPPPQFPLRTHMHTRGIDKNRRTTVC